MGAQQPTSGVGSLSDIDQKIYHEQTRLIYNQGRFLVVGSTLCAFIITFFFWRHLPVDELLYWFGIVGVISTVRLWCIYLYKRAHQQSRQRPIWGTLFWLGMLASGLIWGAWPLIFYSYYSAEYLLLVSTVFAGMVAMSGAAAGSLYLPAFLAFSVPLILPLSVVHMLSGRDSLALVGLLLIVYLAASITLTARANRQNRELLCSRFENQQLMESLGEEKQIAERAMVAKSRFLAAASHDLRQPLHAMGLFLSALRNGEHDPKKMQIIDDMSQSAEALNGLFKSLLDVSRLDAEIIEFNPVHIPASRLFDALRAQFSQQAAKKNVQLHLQADEHVLHCDVILLERVLRNLLSNAVQYTHSGSITLNCESNENGDKLITLEDTGIGIPAEFVDDVFSEYYQLNNPSRDRGKGLGLGLAIVRRLCDLMGLPLEMESVEGEGTVFRVVVPAGDPALIVNDDAPSHGMVSAARHVLVIDDERQVRQSMRHMLEGWGCEVMLASSARDALKVLALSDVVPDIIVSDYRLGDNMNGVDAVETVRESVEASIPAILVTGDTSPERLKEVAHTGLNLLHKPVSPSELNELMQKLFEASDNATTQSFLNLQSAANQ